MAKWAGLVVASTLVSAWALSLLLWGMYYTGTTGYVELNAGVLDVGFGDWSLASKAREFVYREWLEPSSAACFTKSHRRERRWGLVRPRAYRNDRNVRRLSYRHSVESLQEGVWWHIPDRAVAIPMWLVLVLLALPTAFLWHRDRRPPAGHCQNCGYNLHGLTEPRCPECGTGFGR